MDKDLDGWDPMAEDFRNRRVNSYREGVGQDLQNRDQSDAPSRSGRDGGYKPVTLYVSNIPLEVDEMALTNIFVQEGKVMKVSIPEQSAEKAARFGSKIGFVTMENTRGAQAAIENLNGYKLKNKILNVKVKLSKEELTRRKENQAREAEYIQKFTTGRPNGDAGAAHPRMQQTGASGIPTRNAGPHGDAASVSGALTVTVENGLSRRVQDGTSGMRGGAAVPTMPSYPRHGSQTSLLGQPPASAAAGVGRDDTIENKCGKCGKAASLRCQACKSVYYCNNTCQAGHWTIHKKVCTFERRDPAPPVKAEPLLATPDFENMQVDIDKDFLENNQQYLREWIQSVDTRSEKSGQGPVTRPKFHSSSPRKPNEEGPMAGGRQGQGPAMQKPQGLNRPGPTNQEGAPFSGGPKPQNMNGESRREPFQQQQGQQRPGQFQSRQGKVQPAEESMDARSGPFQNRPGQPGPDQKRGGPGSDGNRSSQFRRNNENRNQQREFQDQQRYSSGSEQEGSERFRQQRGGAGPQRGNHAGQRKPVDQPRRDGQGPQQRRGGPNQFDGQRRDGQGQQQGKSEGHNTKPGQFQPREEEKSSPKQNLGPNFKQQERNSISSKNGNERGAPRSSPPKPERSQPKEAPALSSKATSPAGKTSLGTPEASVAAPQHGASVSLKSSLADSLELKKTYVVLVSHMDSPQSFWVQVLGFGDHILTAVAEAAQGYTGRETPVVAAGAGQRFFSEFMGELARVQVVSVANKNVKVFYMDYGNSEDKQVSGLLPLPPQITDLPGAAIECSLQVVPATGSGWSDEVVNQFKRLYNEQICTLTPLRKTGTVVEVSLLLKSNDMDATKALLDTGLGITPGSPLTPKVSTPQRVMVANMPNTMDKLSVGQHLDLIIIDTENPLDIFTRIFSLEEAFGVFSDRMMADYSASPEVPYLPVVGELVASRFSANKVWYRAEVLEVDRSKEEASVFYVDFGNQERLPFKELRAMKSEYADLPIHGFHSAVGGISPPGGGQWSAEHMQIYAVCLNKYVMGGEMPRVSVIVESIQNKLVWLDVVREGLQHTLSEELLQQIEGSRLPEPIQPQVVPSSPVVAAAPAVQTSMPALETSSPKQAENDTSTPVAASGTQPATLDTTSLPLGELVVCGVQEIVSCQEFYVTRKEAEDHLKELQEKLNSFCGGATQEQPEAVQGVSKGDLVLVQFSADNEWYRGRVEQISDDGKRCQAFFLDFGNTEEKDVSSLKALPPALKQIPAQAITCKLAGVPPPVSEEVELGFKSTCLQTEVQIKAVGKQEDDHYFVEVYTANNHSITSVLGIQASRKGAQRNQDSSRLPSTSEGQQACEGSLASSVTVGAPASDGKSGQDDAQMPLRLSCLERAVFHCQDVVVTHVVNPHHLYVMTQEQNVAQHNPEGMVAALQTLNTSQQPLARPPVVGELLCGLFMDAWFRCEVIEVMTPKVRVHFFDYGNEAVVDLSELAPLPAVLCKEYPIGTFRCSLHGIKPPEGQTWDEETNGLVKKLLENQFFNVDIKSKEGEVYQVSLTQIPEDWDVGQKLLESGSAVSSAPAQMNPEKAALLRQMQELQAKLAAMGDDA